MRTGGKERRALLRGIKMAIGSRRKYQMREEYKKFVENVDERLYLEHQKKD